MVAHTQYTETGNIYEAKYSSAEVQSLVLCLWVDTVTVHLLNINSSDAAHPLCPCVIYIPCRLLCDWMEVVYLAVIHPNQLPTLSGMSFGYLQWWYKRVHLIGCPRPQAPCWPLLYKGLRATEEGPDRNYLMNTAHWLNRQLNL